jgi:hypothetical protein
MSRTITEFKSGSVQRPQREKVQVRRILEAHVGTLRAVERVAQHAGEVLAAAGKRGLPSSEPGRRSLRNRQSIVEALADAKADVVVDQDRPRDDLRYDLEIGDRELRVRATVGVGITEPRVRVGNLEYRLAYAAGRGDDPPVLIRNRPREIVFNAGHPAHTSAQRQLKYQLSLALELAYLLDADDAAALYERMVSFMEVL